MGVIFIKVQFYVPGTRIGKADGLSRRLDWKVGVEKDNEDWITY